MSKGSKARLSLISGVSFIIIQAENKYDEFKKSFFYELWDKNVLNLTNFEALNLLIFANKSILADSIYSYEQACK